MLILKKKNQNIEMGKLPFTIFEGWNLKYMFLRHYKSLSSLVGNDKQAHGQTRLGIWHWNTAVREISSSPPPPGGVVWGRDWLLAVFVGYSIRTGANQVSVGERGVAAHFGRDTGGRLDVLCAKSRSHILGWDNGYGAGKKTLRQK